VCRWARSVSFELAVSLTLVIFPAAIAIDAAASELQSTAPQSTELQTTTPPRLELPYQEWLKLPDRREIPWEVKFSPPQLTYDQRQMVELRVMLSGRSLQRESVHRDLQMLVKVGTGEGHWFDDDSYMRMELTQKVVRQHDMHFVTRMYLAPGRYWVAVMLYDSVLNRRNLVREWVEVAAIKGDPLPQLNRDLPPLEFVSPGAATFSKEASHLDDLGWTHDFPSQHLPHRGRAGFPRPEDDSPRPASAAAEESGPLEPTAIKRRIPLDTPRPVQIDVLINFSPSAQFTGMAREYHHTAEVFWQIAQVLSQLDVPHGCVRLTGVDVLGRQVLFEQLDVRQIDWTKLAAAISGISSGTVDVGSLQGRKETAAFFRDAVEHLLTRSEPGCNTPPAAPPLHVYVIAASGMVFPAGTHREPVGMAAEGNRRVYYLRAALSRRNQWDEMEDIVKPLNPRLLTFDDPMHFRKALGSIVSDLQSSSAAPLPGGR
jgi:hypothetical protein